MRGPCSRPTGPSRTLHCLVDGALGKPGRAAAKEAQLGIGPVAAVAQRPAQKMIEPRDAVGAEGRFAGEQGLDFLGQLRADFFVGVEREDPVAGGVGDCGVFLRGEALPRLLEDARAGARGRGRGSRRSSRNRRRRFRCAQRTLARVRGRLAASLRVMRATESVFGIEARINRQTAGSRDSESSFLPPPPLRPIPLRSGFKSAAATFSSRCATLEVPGIGSRTGERCKEPRQRELRNRRPCRAGNLRQLLRRRMVRLQQLAARDGVPRQEADAVAARNN